MLLAYLVVLCVTGKGGYVIKISNFHSKCKETTGPLKCHPKVSPSFFFATFFYPIFAKPFFGDFFGDFLLATFFPRYVLSDFFFGDFLLRLLPRAQSTVRAGKWRFQHHRQRRVIGLCLLRNPL